MKIIWKLVGALGLTQKLMSNEQATELRGDYSLYSLCKDFLVSPPGELSDFIVLLLPHVTPSVGNEGTASVVDSNCQPLGFLGLHH